MRQRNLALSFLAVAAIASVTLSAQATPLPAPLKSYLPVEQIGCAVHLVTVTYVASRTTAQRTNDARKFSHERAEKYSKSRSTHSATLGAKELVEYLLKAVKLALTRREVTFPISDRGRTP